jgi:outer membrane receptor protein involved in Fe transport
MRIRTKLGLGAAVTGAALSLSLSAPPALAQNAAGEEVLLEEIVVTAQKREESLQDVPLSVEAVSGAKLADAGIVRLDDLKAYVPNLQMTETGIANNIYIRGIGSGLNQGFEQSVSTYADGVYRGRGHQSRMPFLDLARVEVLRGPQPILFGKNAVAGAVNLVSATPGDTFEGNVRASYDVENQETLGSAMLSGPISDSFGARAAIHYRKADGYVKNLTLNRDEPQRDEFAGRLTFAFKPSDSFDATLKIEGGSYDVVGRQIEIFGETPTTNPAFSGLTYGQIISGGALPLLGRPNGLPQGTSASARNTAIDYQRSSNGDSSNLDNTEAALTMNWRLAGGTTITSVTGYSTYDLNELCDCDFVGATVFNAGVTENYDQLSEELRFTSPTDQKVAWIGGLYYQDYQLDESDYLYVPANSLAVTMLGLNPLIGANAAVFANAANPRVFAQDSTLWSAFLQATYNVNDQFRVTAGGRYSDEHKTGSRVTTLTNGLGGPAINPAYYPLFCSSQTLGICPHSISGKRNENNFSPLVNFQYDLDVDTLTYFSWSRGSKAGGFDARSNKAPSAGGTFEFEDETATTYEAGFKSAITGVSEVNVAVFYTDYKDLQTSAFDGAIGFNVGNGSARVKGMEIEGRWQATPRLRLSGSMAYLDFEWTKYFGQCYFGLTPIPTGQPNAGNCDYRGYGNQLAPKFTGVLSGEYTWPVSDTMRLRGTLDMLHSSDYITSLTLDPATIQKAYTKFNARLALSGTSDRWEVALVGRNLTDVTVLSYSGDTPLASRLFGARSYYGFVDPPRSVALEVGLRF